MRQIGATHANTLDGEIGPVAIVIHGALRDILVSIARKGQDIVGGVIREGPHRADLTGAGLSRECEYFRGAVDEDHVRVTGFPHGGACLVTGLPESTKDQLVEARDVLALRQWLSKRSWTPSHHYWRVYNVVETLL